MFLTVVCSWPPMCLTRPASGMRVCWTLLPPSVHWGTLNIWDRHVTTRPQHSNYFNVLQLHTKLCTHTHTYIHTYAHSYIHTCICVHTVVDMLWCNYFLVRNLVCVFKVFLFFLRPNMAQALGPGAMLQAGELVHIPSSLGSFCRSAEISCLAV